MKKNDKRLILIVVIVACLFLAFHFLGNESGKGTVEVRVDGTLYGTYSLEEEQTIEVNETNRIEITDQVVRMIWAECPDQICVDHKAISRAGESIICLPNKVVVSIVDGDDAELDAVAN